MKKKAYYNDSDPKCCAWIKELIADGVDAGWLQSDGTVFPLAQNVKGRVGLLKGFGNAIVPTLAAEFISAYMECLTEPGKPA